MTLPRAVLSLLALSLLAAPSAADRLLVAGPDGVVMQANTSDGVFESFAQCSGPIVAMAADDERLYTADAFGQVLVFDVQDGALQSVFSPNLGQINALAAAGGSLFVGTEDALVVRLDPLTGIAIDKRVVPSAVRALLAHGGNLYAGAADTAVYRAPVADGSFEYFSCFCFFNIQDLIEVRGQIAIVDEFGTVAVVGQSGEILTAFSAGATNSMAELTGDLLFYYQGSGGAITRINPSTGQPHGVGFTSPIGVDVMLVIPEGPRPKARRADHP